MDNTEKAREIINKHLYLHGGDRLVIADGNVYRAVLDAVIEALTIPAVSGKSEQLNDFVDFYNSRKLSHDRINYDEIDIFLESI